jgi:DNA-binding MarR family transcriptional regulator
MMRELAEHLAVAVNSMTAITDGLEKKGLVRRQRSEEDRRVIRVELTDPGRESYQSLVEVNLRWFRSMLSALTEDEQDIFMALFRKIARAGRSQARQVASTA